jgi:5'-nucleotidase
MLVDGFESLMTTETGGTCEELVAAENGILISMMLRQYFMALKTLGQWMHWGQGLDRHWNHVVNKVDEKHPHIKPDSSRRSSIASKSEEPAKQSAVDTSAQTANATGRRKSTWLDLSPAQMRDRRAALAPIDEHDEDHGANEDDADTKEEAHETDRELSIMRKVVRKWSRLAGVRGKTGEHLPEEEFTVDWTRAIAPRVEGRIVMVGDEVNPEGEGPNNP